MKRASAVPILCAAVGAAIASTVIELLLWAMSGDDAVRNLLRDARLTAAIVMGPRVLGAPGGFDPLVMGVATLVHAVLSVAYAAVLVRVIRHLSLGPALLAGGVFGLLLYGVNLYGFTTIFPWFTAVRDTITLIAHLMFGITAAAVYCVAQRHATR